MKAVRDQFSQIKKSVAVEIPDGRHGNLESNV